ncbi:MAG: AMP-binding protein [Minwuia sp.]|nr:AMP-binding protein [Minwuia sp.]
MMDLAHWIEGWADQTPDKPAIVADEQTLTYAGFARAIDIASRALVHELGVRSGDRVAHLGENSVARIVLFFACARAGASLVTLNWRLAPPEHGFQLTDSGASVLFADPAFIAHATAIPDALSDMKRICLGAAHADLAEYAAVGRPDPRWDEVPVIVAVPHPGQTVDVPALLALFEGRLARFKHPKDVVTIGALPRNALGKVLKYELRAMLAGD